MKKHIFIIIIFLFTFSHCKDGIKILDKEVTFSKSFDLVVPENGSTSLTIERSFDASSEPEVQEIINQIDRYEVNHVGYSISDFSGEPTNLEELEIIITSKSGVELATETLTNIDLQAISGAGLQLIDFEPAEFNAVEEELKKNNAVNMSIHGEIDNSPVSFGLDIIMNVTIEYRVLD